MHRSTYIDSTNIGKKSLAYLSHLDGLLIAAVNCFNDNNFDPRYLGFIGGAAMGADPATSMVNRDLQSRDVPNVFVQAVITASSCRKAVTV